MKKIYALIIILILVCVNPVLGLNFNNSSEIVLNKYEIEWVKTYGDDEFDMFHCVHQTIDNGFIVSGVSEIEDSYYPILMKINVDGDEEWKWTTQQITYLNEVYDIIDVYPIFSNQLIDSSYLFCLWLDINYQEELQTIACLIKFNNEGQEEWIEFYSEQFDWFFRPVSFIEVEDGFVLSGTSGHPNSYMGEEAGLLKTDKMGKQLWYKEYDFGEPENNRMEAVRKTNDDGFILSGWGSDVSTDYWMIKTDENGNKIWEATFGGDGDDYCHSKNCYQTNDGGYVIGGFSNSVGSGGFDVWIIKTDSNGNIIWNKTYGDTKNDVCWCITSTADGGFVAVVTFNYGGFFGDKDDIHLVKLDCNGNIVWMQEYGGPGVQLGGSIDNTADGGFIVSGCTGSFHSSNSDALLVKYTSFENQRPSKPETPDGPSNGKPDVEYTFATSSSDPDGDSLKYLWDWGDGNFSEILESNEATYNWSYKDNFEIRVRAIDEHGGESDWSEPLPFSTPRNKIMTISIIQRLLSQFQIIELLIKMRF